MRPRVAAFAVMVALMLPPARAQGKPDAGGIAIATIEAGLPVADFVLCDVDGDGITDAVFTTKTRPAHVVLVRGGPALTFAPPAALELPGDCDGLIVHPADRGAAILVLAGSIARPASAVDFHPVAPREMPAGTPPPILGFSQDVDGDGRADALLPREGGFVLASSATGENVPVRPPGSTVRTGGVSGLLAERRRFPVVTFERLAEGVPMRPVFFADDALVALSGDLHSGFGPGVDCIVRTPSAKSEATLERTEARLLDADGDGRKELLVARTKTRGAAITDVRTELIFHHLFGADPGKPAQAILLPGVLSSGPELRDVDGDGRLDLFLSVFGEEIGQHLTRRITGRVRLDYLLYRGAAKGMPFERAPAWTASDQVPEAAFSDWGLRHRLMLDDDWTGDGAPDLVTVIPAGDGYEISVRAADFRAGRAGFAETPALRATFTGALVDHRPWRLLPRTPAIACRTATGAVIAARR